MSLVPLDLSYSVTTLELSDLSFRTAMTSSIPTSRTPTPVSPVLSFLFSLEELSVCDMR
jgi:hypothetical protein